MPELCWHWLKLRVVTTLKSKIMTGQAFVSFNWTQCSWTWVWQFQLEIWLELAFCERAGFLTSWSWSQIPLEPYQKGRGWNGKGTNPYVFLVSVPCHWRAVSFKWNSCQQIAWYTGHWEIDVPIIFMAVLHLFTGSNLSKFILIM